MSTVPPVLPEAVAPPVGSARRVSPPAPALVGDDITLIQAPGRWPRVDLRELWRYRELLFFLVWRDIKVRYAQTVLGIGWTVLQPLLSTVIFTVIFGIFARLPSDNVPYPLFALAALVPWLYFSHAFGGAGNSLVDNANLIGKVYFPRLVVPFASILSGLVDFAVSFAVLILLMLWYGTTPGATLLLMPFLVIMMMMTAAGVGCWLAALNVQYRDVRYAIPFLAQVWLYASPIVYPISLVPERYHAVYALNPMAGVIEGFRTALLGTGAIGWSTLGISFASGAALFVSGVLYFLKLERSFADVV